MAENSKEHMKRKTLIKISICLILFITSLTFLPSLKNNFTNWDDNLNLTDNPNVKSLSLTSLSRVFTLPNYFFIYTPSVQFSYALEYYFFRLNPFIYHATNLILHLLNSLLVFWLILLLSNRIEVALVTALIFGIHPLQVEPVAWISGRKDVLYAFFFLWSVIAYLYYLKTQSRRDYYFSLAAFILSLSAKAVGVTLVFILAILDYLKKRKPDRYAIMDKIPFLSLSIIVVKISLFGEQFAPARISAQLYGLLDRFLISNYVILVYLKKIFLPVKISCFYPLPGKTLSYLPTVFILSPAIVVSLVIIVILLSKYTRKAAFGCLFFMLTLFPVLPVFHLNAAFLADRYIYIPCIGIFYVISEGFFWLYRKDSAYGRILKHILIIILLISISVLAFLASQRVKVWKNSVTLWTDVLQHYPDLAAAYKNRGEDYVMRGDLAKAFVDFTKLIEIAPNDSDSYVSLANVYALESNFSSAFSNYDKALQLNPKNANAYYNRAAAYTLKKEYDKSLEDIHKAMLLGYKVPANFIDKLKKALSKKNDFSNTE